MALAPKAQFDSAVDQAFFFKPFTNPGFAKQVNCALLQDSGAHALFAILSGTVFENYSLNSLEVEQVRENQPCRSGSDDADLCAHRLLLYDRKGVRVKPTEWRRGLHRLHMATEPMRPQKFA